MKFTPVCIEDIKFVNELFEAFLPNDKTVEIMPEGFFDINMVINAIYTKAIIDAGFTDLDSFEIYENGSDSHLRYYDGDFWQDIEKEYDLNFYFERL